MIKVENLYKSFIRGRPLGMMKISLLGTWVAVFCLIVALTASRALAVEGLGAVSPRHDGGGVLRRAWCSPWRRSSRGARRAAWWDQWIGFGLNMKNHGVTGVRGSRLDALRIGLLRLMFISATLLAGARRGDRQLAGAQTAADRLPPAVDGMLPGRVARDRAVGVFDQRAVLHPLLDAVADSSGRARGPAVRRRDRALAAASRWPVSSWR